MSNSELFTIGHSQHSTGQFLDLLHGRPPEQEHRRVLDVSLILFAEHEFNASTFTARVSASPLSDMY
jgi:2-methylcitrate synthase